MIAFLRRHLVVLALYIAGGVAVYWHALHAFFVSDDFEFLTIVASAKSVLVIFEPLVGRFVRPFVVLVYYICYRGFGLTAWPYHAATLAFHLAASFLVYLVARRLFSEYRGGLAFVAGLLFLFFSAHSEAVAWPAGVADPIVAVALLISFLLYLRALSPGTTAWYVAGAYAAMLAAVLTKEVWVTYPGILFAHAVLLAPRDRRTLRRAGALIAAASATVLLYLAMRSLVFGSVAGGYGGLGTSFGTSMWPKEVAAFVLRCFVPAGTWAMRAWRTRGLVLALIAAAVLAWRARGAWARVAVFTGLSLALALLPVLPLTISVATTESERFTYVATAFSSMFIVAAAFAVFRSRTVTIVLCLALAAWHARVLLADAARWQEAGELARGIVSTFAAEVRAHDADRTHGIFILNLPDNLHGAYIFRRGFYPAVQLFEPDVADRTARTVGIATNNFERRTEAFSARQLDARTFRMTVLPEAFVQGEVPSSSWYRIVAQAPGAYDVRFAETIISAVVFDTSGGRVNYVGSASGSGVPFGAIDIPSDNAVCSGTSVRFSGWALDDRGVRDVTLSTVGEKSQVLGTATWATGTRPDVQALFGSLPNSQRAEWDFQLACALVASQPAGGLRVSVEAIDTDGHRVELGQRTVRPR